MPLLFESVGMDSMPKKVDYELRVRSVPLMCDSRAASPPRRKGCVWPAICSAARPGYAAINVIVHFTAD